MVDDKKNYDLKDGYSSYDARNLDEDVHLRDYLSLILKHRWKVIVAFVIIVMTTVIGTFSITPTYTASATIQIEKEAPKVLKFEDVLPINTSGSDYYKTQQMIIQSRAIASRVIEELSLWNHDQFKEKGIVSSAEAAIVPMNDEAMNKLIDDFLKLLDVRLVRKSRLANISFSSHYPELSALVANEVARAYIDFNLEYKFKATETARDWLSGQLKEFQVKVERSEEELNRYASRHGIFSLEKDKNLVLKRLDSLNEALAASESDRIRKESFFKEAKRHPPQDIPSSIDNDHELINGLKKELSNLEVEYSKLSIQLYKPEYPRMVRLKAEIDALEARIEKEAVSLVDRAGIAYKISLERERLLRQSFEKQKRLALRIKEKSIQYNILKREVDTNKELYDGLLQRVKETGVSAGLETSNIQILDRAVTPLRPTSPKKALTIFISMFVGLSIGIGLAFSVEYFDNTVKDPDEISKLFGLPTLGLIPSLQSTTFKLGKKNKGASLRPGTDDLDIVTFKFPQSAISAAYHTFKTSLLFSTPGRPPKTILVTSSNPNEGKTTVSCNLGILLAQSGSKTLIIDADLRKPGCHKAFNVPIAPGITDYLTGHSTLEDVIKPAGIKDLFVLPSGPISPNPPELLDSVQFGKAIEKLKGLYDFIIFDSAPIMVFADTLNMTNKVDGTVIVVKSEKTTKDDLKNAVGLIRGVQAPILGMVINAIEIKKSENYYSFHDYYGDSAEEKDRTATT